MSKKYIESEDVLRRLIWASSEEEAIIIVRRMPAADVAPVVHGAWGEWENGAGYYCTVCGKDALCDGVEQEVLSNYCPNCGARMNDENSQEG